MKRLAPFIACFYFFCLLLPSSLFSNVLPVSESTVTGAAADDYYKSSRAQLKVLSNNKVGQTLVASEALSSTAALSGLVSGAAGLAGVAYYERTGKDPVYAAFNAVATAADALFVPAYQSFKANFVSPESYPASAAQYVGVEGSVGAKLGDIIDFVKSSSSSAYDGLRNLINSSSTYGYPSPEGKVVQMGTISLLFPTSWTYQNYYSSNPQSSLTNTYGDTSGTYYAVSDTTAPAIGSQIKIWKIIYPHYVNNVAKYRLFYGYGTVVGDPATVDPTQTVDYPTLKDKLLAPPAGVASDIANVLKALPASKLIPATATPNTVAEESAPPAITQADINAALKANTAAVAQAVANAINDIATTNPDDAAAQTAAAQAALEAAKAAEAAAEAANQPEPEPEPSYPVPSTWYTKTCDLSNGLGSCIDYQQVINATSAFQSTALYQFPNLILQCLGYVEGDGCEYPPKLSVELFTRFSNGPINIDLSPFESVVKVMKFFFSILCLVGTGKATMTLFE